MGYSWPDLTRRYRPSHSYCELGLDCWEVWQFSCAPCYLKLIPPAVTKRQSSSIMCLVPPEIISVIQVITPTVSWENHSRFSCMELTHQAWVSPSSPASNSPVATETPCCQGRQGRTSEPEQVPDCPSKETTPLMSFCVDLAVPSIMLLLLFPSSCANPRACSTWLSLTLLRSSIAKRNRDYQ